MRRSTTAATSGDTSLSPSESPITALNSRRGENAKMFDLFFNDPRFRQIFLEYVGETYEDFRGERVG